MAGQRAVRKVRRAAETAPKTPKLKAANQQRTGQQAHNVQEARLAYDAEVILELKAVERAPEALPSPETLL